MSKSFQIWDHFFLLLFDKDSKNLKSFDIGLWEKGKKMFKQSKQMEKNPLKKTFFSRGNLHPLWTKVLNLRPLLFNTFPQGVRKSEKFAH